MRYLSRFFRILQLIFFAAHIFFIFRSQSVRDYFAQIRRLLVNTGGGAAGCVEGLQYLADGGVFLGRVVAGAGQVGQTQRGEFLRNAVSADDIGIKTPLFNIFHGPAQGAVEMLFLCVRETCGRKIGVDAGPAADLLGGQRAQTGQSCVQRLGAGEGAAGRMGQKVFAGYA